ncbi:hypothetical protein ACF0H5_005306 [Mactra antiquata]
MSKVESFEDERSLWRRVRERLTSWKISEFVRSLQSAFFCGKSTDMDNSPIYTGPQVTVPWKGENFKYPEDRYLSNKELREQLTILEMRFVSQTHKLDAYASKAKRMAKLVNATNHSDEQVERLGKMVNGLLDKRKLCCIDQLVMTGDLPVGTNTVTKPCTYLHLVCVWILIRHISS